jgi:hypothetical protein
MAFIFEAIPPNQGVRVQLSLKDGKTIFGDYVNVTKDNDVVILENTRWNADDEQNFEFSYILVSSVEIVCQERHSRLIG